MNEWQFDAIGTSWSIIVDGSEILLSHRSQIQAEISRFDQTYSRFLPDSWVSKLARSTQKTITLSHEFLELVTFGIRLAELTNHSFSINSAALQEAYGYDPEYSFKNVAAKQVTVPLGQFWLEGKHLHQRGLVKFDFGAFGKGYLIDLIAKLLIKYGYQFYLIDGGRDFYATSKSDGSPWTIALEHPTKTDEAIGLVSLHHQGLACSNSHHRQVGTFHHLLDADTGQPIRDVASVYVLAENACIADGVSTALFVSDSHCWPGITHEYVCSYLIVKENLTWQSSPDFPGEVFG